MLPDISKFSNYHVLGTGRKHLTTSKIIKCSIEKMAAITRRGVFDCLPRIDAVIPYREFQCIRRRGHPSDTELTSGTYRSTPNRDNQQLNWSYIQRTVLRTSYEFNALYFFNDTNRQDTIISTKLCHI